jgi:hypothetical protein
MGGLGSKGAELPAPDSGPGARGWQGLGAFFVMLVAMLERVISGFQTGADIAGIHAARAHGIPTGGATPRGFLRGGYATRAARSSKVPCTREWVQEIWILHG